MTTPKGKKAKRDSASGRGAHAAEVSEMLPTVQAPDPAILPRSMPRPLEEGLKGKKDDEMQDKPNIVKMEPNEPREAMPSANTLQAGL